jgi:hypothetical protein
VSAPIPMSQQQQARLDQLAKDLIREDIHRTGGYERLEEHGASPRALTDLAQRLEPAPQAPQRQQTQAAAQQKANTENLIAKLFRYIAERLRALLGRGPKQNQVGPSLAPPQAPAPQPPTQQQFAQQQFASSPQTGAQGWNRLAVPQQDSPRSAFEEVAELREEDQAYIAQAVNDFVRNDEALNSTWDKADLPALQSLVDEFDLDPTAATSDLSEDWVMVEYDETPVALENPDLQEELENTEGQSYDITRAASLRSANSNSPESQSVERLDPLRTATFSPTIQNSNAKNLS